MLVLRSLEELRKWRASVDKKVGFVPTMGCLHDGHISLAKYAKAKGYQVICVSIFVNPTQFGPTEDFSKYPRTEEADIQKLQESSIVDALYLPRVCDIYYDCEKRNTVGAGLEEDKDPLRGFGTFVTVKGFSHQLEGAVRPTHFTGVATVVCKLLNMVQPDGAVFGQKDIQQCIVLKRMILDLAFNLKMHVAPTKREPDGLAMSSRNRYLSPEERVNAVIFPKALLAAADFVSSEAGNQISVKDVKEKILAPLQTAVKNSQITSIDYVSLNDGQSLRELADHEFIIGDGGKGGGVIISATIRMGNTRLLDNILINMPGFFD